MQINNKNSFFFLYKAAKTIEMFCTIFNATFINIKFRSKIFRVSRPSVQCRENLLVSSQALF